MRVTSRLRDVGRSYPGLDLALWAAGVSFRDHRHHLGVLYTALNVLSLAITSSLVVGGAPGTRPGAHRYALAVLRA